MKTKDYWLARVRSLMGSHTKITVKGLAGQLNAHEERVEAFLHEAQIPIRRGWIHGKIPHRPAPEWREDA
jgi:hypothetical protein